MRRAHIATDIVQVWGGWWITWLKKSKSLFPAAFCVIFSIKYSRDFDVIKYADVMDHLHIFAHVSYCQEEVSEETTAQIAASIDDVSSIPLPGSISEPPAEPMQELEQGTEIESQPSRPKHSAYSKWEIAKEPEP